MTRRLPLDVDAIVEAYVGERRSAVWLAREHGTSPATIRSRLVERGVEPRGHAESHRLTTCRPCTSDPVFRAYLLGFVTGDLAVRRINPGGTTIEVWGSTTHPEQEVLVRDLLSPYGRVRTSVGTVRASLDLSFSFLLEKHVEEVPAWIHGHEVSAAYLAGYVDAEGSFGVYDGRARFKVDSYDEHVLSWAATWLRGTGIEPKLRRIARAGDARPGQRPFPKDLWRLGVNRATDIDRLVATLEPHLRHARRRSAATRARTNVLERLARRVH